MTQGSARLATERAASGAGRPRTRISALRSGWPLMLRATAALAPTPVTVWAGRSTEAARVHLAAGAAGPLGGDRLRLEVHVGGGSALVLGEIAPTLLLPGPHGAESRLDVRIHVEPDATLAWLPELVIASRHCRHATDVRVVLESGARLLLHEEVLFGRHGEPPGRYRQRIRVETVHGPLYDQELNAGPDAPGWDGPAVTAGHRAAGTVLVVDPLPAAWQDPGAGDTEGGGHPGREPHRTRPGHALRPGSRTCPTAAREPGTALMRLSPDSALVSALAPDTTTLRRRLDRAVAHLLRPHDQDPAAPEPLGV
ncbi:urease accessory protein UreD [Streptomyces sp. NPDC057245]|uniref:urease accessory protein UreD n=1 Tax=Streptomyces sp. NPDC057245 TaxID=3346065 RepID=UPI0036352002